MEATGVAKIAESRSASRENNRKKKKTPHTPSDSYTFLILLEDKSQRHEGLDHMLLVCVVFVAVTKKKS